MVMGRLTGLKYLEVTFSHHSNGQSGDHFVGGELNHADGNFSTNFLQLAYAQMARPKGIETLLRAAMEVHMFYDASEQEDYSKVRVKASATAAWSLSGHPTRLEWTASLAEGLLLGNAGPDFHGLRKVTTWATITWAPKFSRDLAVFLNCYFGQDYYNINYDEYREVLRAGITTTRGRDRSLVPRAPSAN
jgi:hypothetical protein